jgi:hypothetical protein
MTYDSFEYSGFEAGVGEAVCDPAISGDATRRKEPKNVTDNLLIDGLILPTSDSGCKKPDCPQCLAEIRLVDLLM